MQHKTLALTDGTFLTTLDVDGSLAVDAQGRIWAAGFQKSGLEVYDPRNGTITPLLPALDNPNYVVSTFSAGGINYVGYINASDSTTGSTITYGFDRLENLVPEPASSALMLMGLAAFTRRKRPRRGR